MIQYRCNPKRLTKIKGGDIIRKKIFISKKGAEACLKRRFYLSQKAFAEFSNGVRLGHIDGHRDKRNAHKNAHAWFPKEWDRNEIRKAGEHVASLKRNRVLIDGQKHTGRYRGVTVGIIARKGIAKTIFPFFDVNKHARSKAHIVYKK